MRAIFTRFNAWWHAPTTWRDRLLGAFVGGLGCLWIGGLGRVFLGPLPVSLHTVIEWALAAGTVGVVLGVCFPKTITCVSEWDGPDFSEAKSTYNTLRDLYRPLINSPSLRQLPFSFITNLLSSAQAALNGLGPLKSNNTDSVFRNFAGLLDGFAHQTYMAGIPYLAAGGDALEAARNALTNEHSALQHNLSTLQQNNEDVEQLKKQVQNLIVPAVAGSLSKSFTERRESLTKSRMLWLWILLAFAIGAVGVLSYLGAGIATALGSAREPSNIWAVIAMRSTFVLPVLAFLGFAITQYRKERNFEEEYAHKAAVAVSLPNYGDLVPQGPVRDQIVTGAANVIFSSPISQTAETESSADVITAAKDIIESAAKLMPWKK